MRAHVDYANTRAEEAAALLAINQRRRSHAEATLILVAALSLAVSSAAIAVRDAAVFLPLPPIALILMSLGFQQYADISVIGSARLRLEQSTNQPGQPAAFVYETEVAGIRKRPPLALSVRALQILTWMGLCGGITAGAVIAADQPSWALLLYTGLTASAGISAALSFVAMRRAGAIAERALSRS